MANLILRQDGEKLPRAIAEEVNGVVLYWVKELETAGIHVRGIASLLGWNHVSVASIVNLLEGGKRIQLLEAEIVTPGGAQVVRLVTQTDLPTVLRKIERSKAREGIRDKAGDLRDKLAASGFQLMVAMKLDPARIIQAAQSNLSEEDFLRLRLQVLKLEDKTLSLRHYIATALPKEVGDRIMGITEIKTTEVKEVVVNNRGQVLGHVPGESFSKTELCRRYGLLTRTGKPDYKQLNAYLQGAGLPGDAWDDRPIVTHNAQLKAEYLEQLDKFLGKTTRQQWIGEDNEI